MNTELKQGYINDFATGKPVDARKPEEKVRQEYEKILHEWMTSQEEVIQEERLVESNIDELTFRMMNERFNKKYETLLNEDQKKIIRLFIESKNKNDDE